MENKIKELLQSYKDDTISMRREFHMYPEIGFNEYETSKKIKAELDEIGIPYETVAKTGVVGIINCGNKGKTIALRADIDALELTDEKDVSYKSKIDGLCHACGHDGHTAMLLTAAKVLHECRDELSGTIKLIFQPAEESIIGAKKMMEDNDFIQDVDGIFGMHLMTTLETGKIGYSRGAAMASADGFRVIVKGFGGHGSTPHMTIDSSVVASAIVLNMQSIISREIPPYETGVVTFGVVNAGSRYNIIADTALLEGTIRSYNNDVRHTMCEAVKRIASETAKAYRASAEVEFFSAVNPLINDNTHVDRLIETAKKIVSTENVEQLQPMSGSDDFAEFAAVVPGVYAIVGAKSEEKGITTFHHHPKFDIDEDSLAIGSELYVRYVIDFLSE